MSRDYENGDIIGDTIWRAMKNAMDGNGVFTAPTLTPGPGAMDVSIGAGDVYRNASLVTITPGNVTFTVASAKSKWGAIWIPASGVPYALEGSEADKPQQPNPTSWDDVLVGMVLITVGLTTITANDIIESLFTTPLLDHIQDVTNPHSVTYSQTGAEQAFSKNTAFNKNFGTGTSNVPEIGTTLTADKMLKTDGSGKLAPASGYIPVSGDIIKSERFGFAKDVIRESVSATSWALIGVSMSVEAALDTAFPNIPGCTKKYRFSCIGGGLGASVLEVRVKVGGVVKDTISSFGASTFLKQGTPFTLTNTSFTVFYAEALVSAGSNYVYDWWIDVIWVVD